MVKIGFDTAENEFSKVCQVVGQLDRLNQAKRRLMIWDWDDTLFPSTWISCQGLRLEDEAPDPAPAIRCLLNNLAFDVERTLRLALSLGNVTSTAAPYQLSRDPTNFRGLVLGCIEAKFCK